MESLTTMIFDVIDLAKKTFGGGSDGEEITIKQKSMVFGSVKFT